MLAAEGRGEGDNSMRKLMSLAIAGDAMPAGPSDAIIVEGAVATFSGALQEPAITIAPMPHRS